MAARREKLLLKIIKGGLVPADGYTQSMLRERQYNIGDVVLADLSKPRNPGFHRLAHALGKMIAKNVEEFAGLDGHAVLKRLQIEGNIECDEIPVNLEILGQKIRINHRIPQSLGFASMGEEQFKTVIRRISNHVAMNYWPSLTGEQIEEMALMMPESA